MLDALPMTEKETPMISPPYPALLSQPAMLLTVAT